MRNIKIFSVLFVLFLFTINSALADFSLQLKPKDNGKVDPRGVYDYEFRFTDDATCATSLLTNTTTVTLDDQGEDFYNVPLDALGSTVPAYMCEYRAGSLRETHEFSDVIFDDARIDSGYFDSVAVAGSSTLVNVDSQNNTATSLDIIGTERYALTIENSLNSGGDDDRSTIIQRSINHRVANQYHSYSKDPIDFWYYNNENFDQGKGDENVSWGVRAKPDEYGWFNENYSWVIDIHQSGDLNLNTGNLYLGVGDIYGNGECFGSLCVHTPQGILLDDTHSIYWGTNGAKIEYNSAQGYNFWNNSGSTPLQIYENGDLRTDNRLLVHQNGNYIDINSGEIRIKEDGTIYLDDDDNKYLQWRNSRFEFNDNIQTDGNLSLTTSGAIMELTANVSAIECATAGQILHSSDNKPYWCDGSNWNVMI